jgi:zinc protease
MDTAMNISRYFFAPICSTALLLSLGACQKSPNMTDVSEPSPQAISVSDTTDAAPQPVSTAGHAASSSAAAPAFQAVILDEREDRRVVELPNRMILVAQSVPTAPVVSAQVWVKTGSLFEQEHVGAGLSHFLEHLVSGGSTANRPEAESTRLLGEIGAQTNAATSLDTVRYYINTTAAHTPTAIELLSDWLQNSAITETEFARERDVIQSEFSMGQGDPGRIHWKLTQQVRYDQAPDHPGTHPTIGYLDEFLTVTRDELYDFYRRMYVPNNMVFVVVGDIEPAAVIDQLAERWADVPAGELPELSFPVMRRDAAPAEAVAAAAIKRPRVRLLWPGVRLGGEYDYALDLLAGILGQGESSRLVRELRDNRQLVTSIDAFNFSAHWGEGFFGVDYELAEPGVADAVRSAVVEQIERLSSEPVTEIELARVKRQVLARVLKAGQSAEALAASLARNVIASADPDYLPRYAEAVQGLTPRDLMAAAEAVLDPDLVSVARLEPIAAGREMEYQTRPPAVETTANGEGPPREVVDLDNYRLLSDLRANLAEADGDASSIRVAEPVVRELSNGLTVLVQRSTVVPAVAMQLYTKGGLLADGPGREGVAQAAYRMLMRGTQQRTAQELAVAIEDLGAGISTASGNNTSYIRASALADDWPTVMELMAEVLLQPAFDEAEWAKLQPRLLAGIDRATDAWHGELRSVFLEAYYGDHPWSQLAVGRRDVVESLTVDDLRRFHEQRLNAADSVLAVVGDVGPEAVFEAAERLFGGMQEAAEISFVLPQPVPPTPGLTVHSTDKPVAAVQVGYGPGITRDSDDYAALQVLSRVLGDFPAGWLQQELRGRGPGLVYASNAGASTGLVPGYFTMLFNTQPDKLEEALERTLAVAERARTERIDEATLARAKAKVLTTEFLGRQSNADLAAGQALDLLYGVDDLDGSRFLSRVEALDADDIRAVARKYLGQPTVAVISNEELDEAKLRAIIE